MTRNQMQDQGFGISPSPGSPLSALVVSASPHLRRLIASQISQAGYQVGEAGDGVEAILRIRRSHPNVLIVDSSLPDISGIGLCRKLRERPEGCDPYVLLLLARGDEDRLLDAFEAGMDDYITLPFQPWALLSRLAAGERILRLQMT